MRYRAGTNPTLKFFSGSRTLELFLKLTTQNRLEGEWLEFVACSLIKLVLELDPVKEKIRIYLWYSHVQKTGFESKIYALIKTSYELQTICLIRSFRLFVVFGLPIDGGNYFKEEMNINFSVEGNKQGMNRRWSGKAENA